MTSRHGRQEVLLEVETARGVDEELINPPRRRQAGEGAG